MIASMMDESAFDLEELSISPQEKEIRSDLTTILADLTYLGFLADLTYLGFVRSDDHSILYSRPPEAQHRTPDQPHANLSKKP
ncbi:hypothetical protein H4Q26_012405 [Puccinia striiformis f. sp. tritici PST-130]|nr:hypothetical protein H4Q26_012405 [Puccinia striiformis f. sp. tritici PST-130]